MMQRLLLTVLLLGAMYLVLEYTNTERLVLRADRVRVIDGDTIAVGETRYRLLGYDTPETKYAKCPEERRLGNRATRRLKELIGNARGIELDVRWRTDKYGRKLARAFVFGQDVAHTMITESLARPYAGGKRGSWCDVKEVSVHLKNRNRSHLLLGATGKGLSAHSGGVDYALNSQETGCEQASQGLAKRASPSLSTDQATKGA